MQFTNDLQLPHISCLTVQAPTRLHTTRLHMCAVWLELALLENVRMGQGSGFSASQLLFSYYRFYSYLIICLGFNLKQDFSMNKAVGPYPTNSFFLLEILSAYYVCCIFSNALQNTALITLLLGDIGSFRLQY